MTTLVSPDRYLPGDLIAFEFNGTRIKGRITTVHIGGESMTVRVYHGVARKDIHMDVDAAQVLGVLS